MNQIKKTPNGYMKYQSVIIFVCLAFLTGVLSGVMLTVYKSKSTKLPLTADKTTNIDPEKMLLTLKKQAAEQPQNAMAWTQLGNFYYDSDQYHNAIEAYEKSINIDPDSPNVLTDLGIMYRRAGQSEKAISYFDKAIKADPKHEMSRLNKGIVLMHDLKKRDQAIKTWEELLAINPLAMVSKNQSVDEMIMHYREHVK